MNTPRLKRDADLEALSHAELLARAKELSSQLQQAKSFLRSAVKTFHWLRGHDPNSDGRSDIRSFLKGLVA